MAVEESGNIAAIDRWVISTLLEWIETDRQHLANTQFICVNLSGGSLNDEQFMEDIFALFARYPSVVHYLCLEITESVALHDLENTQCFIARVHDMGGKIALDDFGAGYTSFRVPVVQVPEGAVRRCSQDRRRIRALDVRASGGYRDRRAGAQSRAGAAWWNGWRMSTTLRALQEIGVDYVQGYIVAKPQDTTAILTARSAASFVKDADVASFVELLSEPRQATVFDYEWRTRAANTH